MKHLFTILCALLIGLSLCHAQLPGKLNAVSIEVGKTGLIWNLGFDHKLETIKAGYRLGAGSNFGKYLAAKTVGGGGYYLAGNTNRFLEIGVDLQYLVIDEVSDDQRGVAIVYPDYDVKSFYPSLNIGYRVYSKNALFRIGLSPGIIDNDFVPGGYISYGLRL